VRPVSLAFSPSFFPAVIRFHVQSRLEVGLGLFFHERNLSERQCQYLGTAEKNLPAIPMLEGRFLLVEDAPVYVEYCQGPEVGLPRG
jgi:hypothetical protein